MKKAFINKLTINGVKNINKPIELLFTNKTIKDNMDFSNSNVKAIYGPNGSGKSGIVSALYIYKRLINDTDGITDKTFSNFIYETINKDLKKLSIEVIFTIMDDTKLHKTNCYKHLIELTINENDTISISKEEISILKDKSIKNENFKSLVLVENGMLKELKLSQNKGLNYEPLYIYSLNLLDKHSITSTIWKLIKNDKDDYAGNSEVLFSLMSILCLSFNITVVLNKEDLHLDYMINKDNETNYNNEEKVNELFKKMINDFSSKDYLINLSMKNRDVISINNFEKYEASIKKLEDFIKIFKPDLDEIIIDKKVNDDKFYCDKIFRYGKKYINVEFESTGIRKLVRLYSALKACANGGIVFIDEMDANLHDVYFTRLIEFFKNDSKGQLCFTTHNLEPINLLKDNAHSLDFISNDSRVYSWTKDGNKSPMSKYINGLIPYSPFNVESFDFDVLLDKE